MRQLFLLFIVFSQAVTGFTQSQGPQVPKGYRSMTTLKLAYVFGRIDLIEEDPSVPDDIAYFRNQTYKIAEQDTLMLDVCFPKNIQEKAPLLVFIYGEDWKRGNKDKYLGYLINFAKKGYVTSSVWYRTSKKAKFPAAIEDVKSAIKWLSGNSARYHIDTTNIAVIGGSTGGYLALMAAYMSNDEDTTCNIKAVVDLYAPVDLTNQQVIEETSAEQFIGKPYSEVPELYQQASPINHVSKHVPPTLIFHGTIDDVVPVDQSKMLENKLKNAGVPVEYHRMKGWPHFMEAGAKVNAYCIYYMDHFFNKYLK